MKAELHASLRKLDICGTLMVKRPHGIGSDHFLAMRHLAWDEKGLHQLALAARDQAGEAFEPLTFVKGVA